MDGPRLGCWGDPGFDLIVGFIRPSAFSVTPPSSLPPWPTTSPSSSYPSIQTQYPTTMLSQLYSLARSITFPTNGRRRTFGGLGEI